MSDIKKIKDEYLNKLSENLDLSKVNQIKTDPKKPNSSENKVKIKSVCFSGK